MTQDKNKSIPHNFMDFSISDKVYLTADKVFVKIIVGTGLRTVRTVEDAGPYR